MCMNVLIVLQSLTFAAIMVAACDQEIQGGSTCPDGNSLVGLCKAKCTNTGRNREASLCKDIAERRMNDSVFQVCVFYTKWLRVRSFFLFIHSMEKNIL